MIGKIFKKFLGKKSTEEINAESFASKIKDSGKKLTEYTKSLIEASKNEYFTIVEKCKNLLETNYKLGNLHLEKGNLSDAIFRFRFIKKFWPNFFEAQYKLAYCLVLKEEFFEARKVIKELLEKDPNNQNAVDLLNQIKSLEEKSEEQNK